jgi:hypothetical protein
MSPPVSGEPRHPLRFNPAIGSEGGLEAAPYPRALQGTSQSETSKLAPEGAERSNLLKNPDFASGSESF